MNNFELIKADKPEHFRLLLNGVDVTGSQHQAVFMHLIQEMDKVLFKTY